MAESILIGKGPMPVHLLPGMANRHGLVAGATGTGKTVTLQRLAEGFSRIGVPVFLADVKGDLAGIGMPGGGNARVAERVASMKLDADEFEEAASPVIYWDIFGEQGHPLRTTISEMGPLLLSRLMGLNEIQEGVMNIVFKIADDNGWLLLDLKDLRALLVHAADNAKTLQTYYGNVSKASVGAIQRRLLILEQQGGDLFFGEPALHIDDLMRTDAQGRGIISVLAADRLIQTRELYSTFLLWLLSELFEHLPEVGDPDRPGLVFFFDEAHLLFDRAPQALLDKVEQVVRLIRSKGVGVYFVSQNPDDIPDDVLGQLGNRVQHALRAYTPRDRKAVKVAAETFRPNPKIDTEGAISELGVGEALVSVLDEKGAPTPVERVLVAPPGSRLGPLTAAERSSLVAASPVAGTYDQAVDRVSAYEILEQRGEEATAEEEVETRRGGERPGGDLINQFARSALRSLGTQVGRHLVRSILGSLKSRR